MTTQATPRHSRHFYYTPENVRHLCLFRTEMKATIRPMRVREAKDFLVAQTAEQAALEGVPLSDLEKRMMYFTEAGEMGENAIELNDAFEAEYNSAEYEAKISRLLHRAYKRLEKEDASQLSHWRDAIRVLRKGDHYILVLWGTNLSGRGPSGISLRIWGFVLLFAAFGIGLKLFAAYMTTASPLPANPRVLLAVFLGIIVARFLFPRQIE